MSWEFIAAGEVQFTSSGDMALFMPVGVNVGDLLVVCISGRANVPFAAPAGWNIIQQLSSKGNTSTGLRTDAALGLMAYRIFESGDTDPTFTRSGGNAGYGIILAYRHTDAIVLGDSGITQPDTGANTITLTTGIETTTPNELIVACLCGADNFFSSGFVASDPSTPSGNTDISSAVSSMWIERSDGITASGADCSLATADALKVTAGNTGPISATHTKIGRHVLIAAAFRAENGTAERQRSRLILTPW